MGLRGNEFYRQKYVKLLRRSILKKDPNELEIWEKVLLSAGNEKCDWIDKKYLKPVLEAIDKQIQ